MVSKPDPAINDPDTNESAPSKPHTPIKPSYQEERQRRRAENPLRPGVVKKIRAKAHDWLKGKFPARRGQHPLERVARQSLANPAPKIERLKKRFPNQKKGKREHYVMARQSLALSGFAAVKSDDELILSAVVHSNDLNDPQFLLVSIPGWRKHPTYTWENMPDEAKIAWMVSAWMRDHGGVITTISLNFDLTLAAKSPKELKEFIGDRLESALGCRVIYCLERDGENRTHCHAIFFGRLDKDQEKKLEQAGGKYECKDLKRQLKAPEGHGTDKAIGWTAGYMRKNVSDDAVFFIPRERTAAGRAHFERVMGILLPYFIADKAAKAAAAKAKAKQEAKDKAANLKAKAKAKAANLKANTRNAQPTSPPQTKVLEETDSSLSLHENIGVSNLRIEDSSSQTSANTQSGTPAEPIP